MPRKNTKPRPPAQVDDEIDYAKLTPEEQVEFAEWDVMAAYAADERGETIPLSPLLRKFLCACCNRPTYLVPRQELGRCVCGSNTWTTDQAPTPELAKPPASPLLGRAELARRRRQNSELSILHKVRLAAGQAPRDEAAWRRDLDVDSDRLYTGDALSVKLDITLDEYKAIAGQRWDRNKAEFPSSFRPLGIEPKKLAALRRKFHRHRQGEIDMQLNIEDGEARARPRARIDDLLAVLPAPPGRMKRIYREEAVTHTTAAASCAPPLVACRRCATLSCSALLSRSRWRRLGSHRRPAPAQPRLAHPAPGLPRLRCPSRPTPHSRSEIERLRSARGFRLSFRDRRRR
jgi:hypothetical protein